MGDRVPIARGRTWSERSRQDARVTLAQVLVHPGSQIVLALANGLRVFGELVSRDENTVTVAPWGCSGEPLKIAIDAIAVASTAAIGTHRAYAAIAKRQRHAFEEGRLLIATEDDDEP